MECKKMIDLLKNMNDNIENKDIIEHFPTVVKDLKFLIEEYPIFLNNLSAGDRIANNFYLEFNRISYLCKIIKYYMDKKWNKEFSYEVKDTFFFNSTGGYNTLEKKVIFSVLGISLNADRTSDIIKTISHEFRHQLQHKFLYEEDIENILTYPEYFITITKNRLPREIKTIVDKNNYEVENTYYEDNYKNIYMEVDANYYGLYVCRSFLIDLYLKYPNKTKELEKEVSYLQEKLIIESKKTERELLKEKRLDNLYIKEIMTLEPITSKVLINDKEEDALLYIDKTINEKNLIEEDYKVLKLIRKDNRPKNYIEIISDKNNYIKNANNSNKIENIYKHIIKSDPILILSEYIVNNNIKGIEEFLDNHPTFINEYKDRVEDTIELLGADEKIIKILTISKNKQKSML